MSGGPYTRTTIRLVVLSEGTAPDDHTLAEIEQEITEGDWSGEWTIEKVETLTREQMVTALIDQGTDPTFLIPDWEG